MTININLLPTEDRPDLSPTNKILVTTIIFFVMVYLCISAFYLYESWSLNQQIKDVDNLSEMLKGTEEKINEANEKNRLVNERVMLVENLMKTRLNKYPLLLHINNDIPIGVWVVKITNDSGSEVPANGVKNAAAANQHSAVNQVPNAVVSKSPITGTKGTDSVVVNNKKNEEAKTVMLSGAADTFILVAKTADTLKADMFFKNAEILGVEEGRGNLKNFLIKCEY